MVNRLLLLKLVLAVSGERARCNFITCTVLRTRSIIHLTVHGVSDGAPDASLIHAWGLFKIYLFLDHLHFKV